MTTDRELLELAAKAAGIRYHAYIDDPIFGTGINIGDIDVPLWNPLADDGDAFRLAVTLGLESRRPSRNRSIGRVVQVWFPSDGNPRRAANSPISVSVNGDVLAATRRAIVRAAAEIGKAMP
jgi:hypothetical protein